MLMVSLSRPTTGFPGLSLLLGCVALASGLWLYGSTVAPGVQGGDSGEFQFVAYILGIPHPPGYPFYAVFGKLWTMAIPVGEIAWRMNLMSAAFAALTLASIAFAAVQIGRQAASAAVTAIVAVAWMAPIPTWWAQSTIASVRPPTGFFVAATIASLVLYERSRRGSALCLAACVFGFGLTHHISIYTLAPAVILAAILIDPRVVLRRNQLIRVSLCGLLPLTLYAYLPIRSAIGTPFDASHPTSISAFLDLVTARGFAGDMLYFNPFAPERIELGRQIFLTNLGIPGIVLSGLGALGLLCWRPRMFVLTAGIVAINVFISLSYRAPVIADYLIPTYIVCALWIGVVPGAIVFGLRRAGMPMRANFVIALALAALMVWSPITQLRDQWPSFDRSGERSDQIFLTEVFASAGPNATVLTDWYHATILWYGQFALGKRLDITVDYVSPEGATVPWRAHAERAMDRGPVYTTALDRELAEAYYLRRFGSLYSVQFASASVPPMGLKPADIIFRDRNASIELVGYRASAISSDSTTDQSDADVEIELAWRADALVGGDYSSFVHLADARGEVRGQRDGTPGEGVYPTSRWRTGETVVERYRLTAAPTAPAGEFQIRVGFYQSLPQGGWKRLDASTVSGESLGDAPIVTRLNVRPRPLPPDPRTVEEGVAPGIFQGFVDRAVRRIRGDGPGGAPNWAEIEKRTWLPLGGRVILTGWALDRAEAKPGESIRVALDFMPRETIPDDLATFVHLVDQSGQLRVQRDSVPVDGGFPTLRWAPQRPVRDVKVLTLPLDITPGTYQVRAGMYLMSNGAHVPVLDEALAKIGQGDHVVLTTLTIQP